MTTHPKGVSFLAFTQMWESFSYFGMRALLVLYLVAEAGYSPQDAFILYTLYIAFVKIFAGAGGYITDQYLEYKEAVVIGGLFILAGHLFLALSSLFFLALGCIVCGASLFRVSLQALLGLLYHKEDPRRAKGFTLLYTGMNVGGLLAAVLCGFVASIYGWHAGFGLAALGMIIGLAVFLFKMRQIEHLEKARQGTVPFVFAICLISTAGISTLLSHFKMVHAFALPLGGLAFLYILNLLRKKMDGSLLLSVGAAFALLIAFFTAEELWGSLLMVFSEDHVTRLLFGVEIPSTAIAATNPLIIILLGPLLVKKDMQMKTRLVLAFLFLSLAFFVLYATSLIPHPSFLYLMIGLASIACGELLLAPSILSFASQSAPEGSSGLMMGAATLAFSLASLLSGEVAKIASTPGDAFLLIGASAFAIFCLLLGWSFLKKEAEEAREL